MVTQEESTGVFHSIFRIKHTAFQIVMAYNALALPKHNALENIQGPQVITLQNADCADYLVQYACSEVMLE